VPEHAACTHGASGGTHWHACARSLSSFADGADPEHEALLADSVGLALQVVLDTLAPAERLAFVLHDMFDVPFDEIAPLVERSPEAARQLASRARRRVRGGTPNPDVVLRADGGRAHPGASRVARGATAVVRVALAGARWYPAARPRPALVNGAAGVIMMDGGQPFAVWGFTVAGGKIVEIDIVSDPERLCQFGPVPQ